MNKQTINLEDRIFTNVLPKSPPTAGNCENAA